VPHYRNGIVKRAEYMSGVLVQLLHSQMGCHGILKTAQTEDDPNHDSVHPYKQAIVTLVKKSGIDVLLDLHIMSDHHHAAIDLGTGRGDNLNGALWLLSLIEEQFRGNDIQPVGVDQIFSAEWPGTVSASVARVAGIACVQIEISWRLLEINSPRQKLDSLLRTLREILVKISERTPGNRGTQARDTRSTPNKD